MNLVNAVLHKGCTYNINQCKMSYKLKDTISLTFLQQAFLNIPWSSVYCYYIFFSIVISALADKSKTCQHFPHIVHLPDFFYTTVKC